MVIIVKIILFQRKDNLNMASPPLMLRSMRSLIPTTRPLVRALHLPPLVRTWRLVEGEATLMGGRAGSRPDSGEMRQDGEVGGPGALPNSPDLTIIDLYKTVGNVEEMEMFANAEVNDVNIPEDGVWPLVPSLQGFFVMKVYRISRPTLGFQYFFSSRPCCSKLLSYPSSSRPRHHHRPDRLLDTPLPI